MILEIARFWSSLPRRSAGVGRFALRGVMGPDEYHDALPGASRAGSRQQRVHQRDGGLDARSCPRFPEDPPPRNDREEPQGPARGLTSRGTGRMGRDQSPGGLVVPFHRDGIISQFEGYEGPRGVRLGRLRAERYGDIQRLDRILEAEGDRHQPVQGLQAGRRPDAVSISWSPEELSRTLRSASATSSIPVPTSGGTSTTTSQRTSHGSTLSRIVHSWVLARSRFGQVLGVGSAWGLESDIAECAGRHHRRGHSPRSHGRHGRPRAAVPDRP